MRINKINNGYWPLVYKNLQEQTVFSITTFNVFIIILTQNQAFWIVGPITVDTQGDWDEDEDKDGEFEYMLLVDEGDSWKKIYTKDPPLGQPH